MIRTALVFACALAAAMPASAHATAAEQHGTTIDASPPHVSAATAPCMESARAIDKEMPFTTAITANGFEGENAPAPAELITARYAEPIGSRLRGFGRRMLHPPNLQTHPTSAAWRRLREVERVCWYISPGVTLRV